MQLLQDATVKALMGLLVGGISTHLRGDCSSAVGCGPKHVVHAGSRGREVARPDQPEPDDFRRHHVPEAQANTPVRARPAVSAAACPQCCTPHALLPTSAVQRLECMGALRSHQSCVEKP